MSNVFNEYNWDYIPDFLPTGVQVLLKFPEPDRFTTVHGRKVDTSTGMTEAGIIAVAHTKVLSFEKKVMVSSYTKAMVIAVGPNAFEREGLQDMKETVLPGKKVWISDFTGKVVRDDEGRKTLFFRVEEQQVVGLVEKIPNIQEILAHEYA